MPDFKVSSNNESFYDIRSDWLLIESSFTKQYGIRLRQNGSMQWDEFCTLLAGLMPDTPLGQVVSIRAEKDPKTIKQFSSTQRKIHNDWRSFTAKQKLNNPEGLKQDNINMEKMLQSLFGKGGE